jgi:DNA-binding IclR family transcriptional regulator
LSKSADSTLRGLRRALHVLESLTSEHSTGVSVTQLARQLDVSKSTVSRLLKTLVEREFASRMPSGRFQLGPNAIRGAISVVGPLIQEASPYLRELSARTGQTAHLAVLVGAECLIVARSCERDGGIHVDEVKEQFPLWATALGKALLAAQLPGVRRNVLPAEPYPCFTRRTARTAFDLFGRIAREESTGFYLDEGEFHLGFRCVSSGIRGRAAAATAALAVSYPVEAVPSPAPLMHHMHQVASAWNAARPW